MGMNLELRLHMIEQKRKEKKPQKRSRKRGKTYNKMKNSVSNLIAKNKKSQTVFRIQSDKNPAKSWF